MPDRSILNMVSYWQIFLIFAKIGAFTIGGGMAMIPLIQGEIVRRGWLKEEDFPDIIALSQSAPGLLAVNIAIFTGYRLKGSKGSIVATIASVLPSILIILLIAMIFTGYQDNPVIIRIFKGIRPVVVALIAVPMLQMARKSNRHWWSYLISAAVLALVGVLKVSPIYILIVVIVISFTVAKLNDKKRRDSIR